jgi:thymidylate kinase
LAGIVIEGIDLTGKSSIAYALSELLGHASVIESPQSGFRTLLQDSALSLSPVGRLALYISANIELGRNFSRSDNLIIAVRYFLSTVAYHAIANQESAGDCLIKLDYLIEHCSLPSAFIIVEASHAERLRRASTTGSSISESDEWSLQGNIHSLLTKAYHEIAKSIDTPILFLDTTDKDVPFAAAIASKWLRSLHIV